MSSISGIIRGPGAYPEYSTANWACAAPPLAFGIPKWYGATSRPAAFADFTSPAAYGLT